MMSFGNDAAMVHCIVRATRVVLPVKEDTPTENNSALNTKQKCESL
jgi:hypothetical protein